MAKVLMVASEAAPFAKTGGLADVLGALPKALAAYGIETAVVLPKYRGLHSDGMHRAWNELPIVIGPFRYTAGIDLVIRDGVPFFFVDIPALFDRPALYGEPTGDYADNHIRFAALSHAALGVARHLFRPNIFHAHDWQAALVPVFLRQFYSYDPTFIGAKSVFTIHNMGYQGRFGRAAVADLGLPNSLYRPDGLEFFGDINLMKGALNSSDAITTVSPRYAMEIQTPEGGFSLDGVLRDRGAAVTGILNGCDYAEWNPATDSLLPARYSAVDLGGKRECKAELLRTFGLPVEPNMDRPLVGIVSRFADQKGFDLIAEVGWDLLLEDMSLVALGSGEPRYEALFRELTGRAPDRFGNWIGYNNALAHLVEAGSDIFVMPSKYEPCGLNQMYSLRYGTPPVVRAVGGLDDTIDAQTGFKFEGYSGWALLEKLREALAAYQDRDSWTALMRRGMAKDYSWAASAARYAELYQGLLP